MIRSSTWTEVFHHHHQQIICIAALITYVVAVRLLRYRRAASIPRKYGFSTRASFASMTADQAQDIMRELVEMEFPKLMGFSIVFALFKTYGFPSVSSLLVSTAELSSTEMVSKRIADTGVLLLEFCLNPPSSPRALEAVARMNYLHKEYIKAGKISNDDMLYTLSVFALEPARWVKRYEWRELTDVELCATGTFWKSMGDKMEIEFSNLPSSAQSGGGWKNGLHWLKEVQAWSEEYEKQHMVPDESNRQLASAYLDVIFLNVPSRFKYLTPYLVSTMIEDRLRKAMMLPEPPKVMRSIFGAVFQIRKLFLRHLALPRPEFRRKKYISAAAKADGRISSREYLSHPWYVEPTFERRWGPKAWFTWSLGRKLPGDDGNRYRPEGYLVKEVGPIRYEKHGGTDMEKDLDRMENMTPGGCPFTIRKM